VTVFEGAYDVNRENSFLMVDFVIDTLLPLTLDASGCAAEGAGLSLQALM